MNLYNITLKVKKDRYTGETPSIKVPFSYVLAKSVEDAFKKSKKELKRLYFDDDLVIDSVYCM
jgi:hypothetical protein